MTKFFGTPFALSGDRDTIPDATQADGSVSYAAGFGFDYERDLNADPPDPDAKAVPRAGTNGILYDITDALRALQRFGVPEYFPAAAPYAINALVRYNNTVWRSRIDNNNSLPTEGANWTAISSVPQASEIAAGIIEIATAAETATGADGTRAVTPAGLKPLLDAKAPLASPSFTGQPKAPSPSRADATDRLANTWWVKDWYANDIAPGVQPALGYTPVRQGGGPSQLGNQVNIGYDGSGIRGSVDNNPVFGQFWMDHNGLTKVRDTHGGANFSGGIQFTIPTNVGDLTVKLFNTGTLPGKAISTVSFPNNGFPTECLGVIPVSTTNQGISGSDDNRFAHGAGEYTKDNFKLYNDGYNAAFLILAFGR